MKTDYGKILLARYEQAKEDREEVVAIGLTEYRARQGIEAWRIKMAEYLVNSARLKPKGTVS